VPYNTLYSRLSKPHFLLSLAVGGWPAHAPLTMYKNTQCTKLSAAAAPWMHTEHALVLQQKCCTELQAGHSCQPSKLYIRKMVDCLSMSGPSATC